MVGHYLARMLVQKLEQNLLHYSYLIVHIQYDLLRSMDFQYIYILHKIQVKNLIELDLLVVFECYKLETLN